MDRVQVIKQESSALGGQDADGEIFQSPIEPQEDALEAAGIYLQDVAYRDETTLISRSGPDMRFKDQSNPSGYTLSQLAGGASGPATEVGQILISDDGSTFIAACPLIAENGWLFNDNAVGVVKG